MKMQYSPNLHGGLMYILMCSKWLFEAEMLSCRTSFEERTYMNLTVNVAVCENWVFSNKFMKRPWSTTYTLHPWGSLAAAQYRSRICVKLVSQKTYSSRHSPLFKL